MKTDRDESTEEDEVRDDESVSVDSPSDVCRPLADELSPALLRVSYCRSFGEGFDCGDDPLTDSRYPPRHLLADWNEPVDPSFDIPNLVPVIGLNLLSKSANCVIVESGDH